MNPGKRLSAAREQAAAFWKARQPRERWLLAGAAALVVVVMPYVAVWEPLAERRAELDSEVDELRQDLAWMRGAAEEIEALEGEGAAAAEPVTDEESLLSLVDRGAQQAGLDDHLSRVQPEGDGTLRVWMDGAPFDDVMAWLGRLQRSGVAIEAMRVERTDQEGVVDVRLTLEVPA